MATYNHRIRRVLFGATLVAIGFALGFLPLTQAAILTAAAAALLLSLRHPWLVWMGLALLLPVAASIRIGGVAPSDLLVAAGLLLWAAHAIARRRWTVTAAIPQWPLLLYIGALLFATLGAGNLTEAVAEVIKWTEFAVLLLVIPLAAPTRSAPWLVAALLAAAATQALLGLYQFIFRIGPDWFIIQDRFLRAYGVFRQPNPYAGYLGLTLPVALSLFLWASVNWWRTRPNLRGVGLLISLLGVSSLMGLGIVASWSRGGWLGAVAAAVVVVAWFHRTAALTLATLVLAGLATGLLGALNPAWIPAAIRLRLADIPAYFGAGDLLNQPITDDNFAVIERLAHWVAALRMWENAPWLGVGPGNYNSAYTTVALPLWPAPLGHAHNIYLNVLAESGVVGLVAFVVLWTALVLWTVRHMRSLPGHDWRRALAVGILGVYTHLALHSLFDNLFVQGIYLHLAFWPAVLATALSRESEDRACCLPTSSN